MKQLVQRFNREQTQDCPRNERSNRFVLDIMFISPEWLKPILPRSVLITDGFEEYALPIFDALNHPMVFCNFLEPDADGFVSKLVVRIKNQKVKAVEEFRRLSFKVIAVGTSFNDIEMVRAADKGILFNPTENVLDIASPREANKKIVSVGDMEALKREIMAAVRG